MEKRCRKNADYYKKSADCAAYVRAEMIYGIILKENHKNFKTYSMYTVSYTHLTLPTIA